MRRPEDLECVLCGAVGPDALVQVGLMRFEDDQGRRYFGTDPRCRDHEGCRARVVEAGGEWPLAPEHLAVVERGLQG